MPRGIIPFALLTLAAAFLSVSCSTVNVRMERGLLARESLQSAKILQTLGKREEPALANVSERCLDLLRAARRQERLGSRSKTEGAYLKAAVEARQMLAAAEVAPGSKAEANLISLHNHALARFAEIWSEDPRRKAPGPYRFSFEGEEFEVRQSADSAYDSRFFDRAVATASIRGKGVVDTHREGFGASLVAIREQTPARTAELARFSARGMHVPVTLAIDGIEPGLSDGREVRVVTVSILDPARQNTIRVADREYPLAADFSAPMELILKGRNEVLWGLEGFFDAKHRIRESGIFLMEPYDPQRIPVILTHGLISVPIIWRDIIPEFLAEPDIAGRYQFMVFTYPSSFPIPESAQLFRNELAALRETYDPEGNDPLSHNIVAMGHSMGGVLTHLLVADLEDRLWNEVSDLPLEELPLPEEAKLEIRDQVFFEPDPAVQRAVFLSAPHGGAELATMSAADLVSRLARFPSDVLVTTLHGTADFLNSGTPGRIPGLKVDLSKRLTSVQSLRPDSPVSVALATSPMKPGVKFHSIIGDRGKGDTPDSSDGVVEYWSSHLSGAESELIVPTGHTTYTHPDAVEDLKRILRLHAGL